MTKKRFKIGKEILYILLFYLIFSLFSTWPLILHLDGFLLSTDYEDISHADTLDHIDYMLEARQEFLDGKDFIIVKSDYAMSQLYVLSGIFLTIFFGINEVIFHNIFFLISFFLSGLFMYLFTLELTADKKTSFFSGFLFMSSNYVLHAYIWGHTNNMQIQWIPLIFLLLEKVINSQKIKYAIYLGVAFAAQIFSSLQYSVYLSFILPLYLILKIIFSQGKKLGDRKTWLHFFLSGFIAFALSSFFLIKRLSIEAPIRTIQENTWEWWSLYSIKQLFDIKFDIYLGHIQFLLLIIGVYILLSNFRDNSYKKFIPFLILLVFLLFSMAGPRHFLMPYYWLYHFWPFVDNFKVTTRLFPFALLCLSILSSLFLLHMKKVAPKHRDAALFIILLVIFISQLFLSLFFSSHHIFYI